MDRELEEQIDSIIQKATKDLKTRICRVVVRHQNKLLKDQAREFKTTTGAAPRRVSTAVVPSTSRTSTTKASSGKKSSAKKDSKYHSDSDSDGYYSE